MKWYKSEQEKNWIWTVSWHVARFVFERINGHTQSFVVHGIHDHYHFICLRLCAEWMDDFLCSQISRFIFYWLWIWSMKSMRCFAMNEWVIFSWIPFRIVPFYNLCKFKYGMNGRLAEEKTKLKWKENAKTFPNSIASKHQRLVSISGEKNWI